MQNSIVMKLVSLTNIVGVRTVDVKQTDPTVTPVGISDIAVNQDMIFSKKDAPDDLLFTGEVQGRTFYNVYPYVVNSAYKKGHFLEESGTKYNILDVTIKGNYQKLFVVDEGI